MTNPGSLVQQAESEYINFPARPVKNCSNNLCNAPLTCKPEGDDYKCIPCNGE